jgi:hypothetical protein
MPYVKCVRCDEMMYAKPRHLKIGWGKFCSQKCQYEAQKNGTNIPCVECKKNLYRTPSELGHSKSGNFFCNKSCLAIWKNKNIIVGEQHVRWKNGEGSYRNILLRAKIKPICRGCKTRNFKVLLVHHRDRNRKNNKLDNLIWLCHNCHFVEHYDDKKRIKMETLV